jgi:GntR family transcriptional regulator/MocR family aminotransferase
VQIPIELDRSSRIPLVSQLVQQIGEAIRLRRIPVGARMPSSRSLSDQLGVGRNTVVNAYETLAIEGLVESRAASGFYATPNVLGARPQPLPVDARVAPAPAARLAPVFVRAPLRINPRRDRSFFDFAPGRPDVELFPLRIWRRLLLGRLSYGGAAGLSRHGDPAGLPALRAAIAEHVAMTRGVVADPSRVVVVSGIQEGLALVARLFLSPDRAVIVEDPCYRGAAAVFESTGARLVSLPVDEDGLVTSELGNREAALAYVTPGHQFPTGPTLSPARRGALMDWARRTGAYLVEDDYDSELQYDGSPLQALAGAAPDYTIYLGTFSTTLGAGLRLGYVIVPPAITDAVRAAKSLLDSGNAWLDQATLAEFLRAGCYRAHLTRSRTLYKERRDALLDSLRRYFGKVETSGEAVGLHVLWRLPAGVPQATRLEELALGHRVGVHSLESAGAVEHLSRDVARRCLVLGFAGLTPAQIDQGIARLSDAIDDTLDTHHDLLKELMLDAPQSSPPRPGRQARQRGATQLRRPSALRTVAAVRANARHKNPKPETNMPIVRGIYRYPIKGLSPQPLPGVVLEEGRPFPFDRVFALTRPGVPIDADEPRWAKKGLFLMLMLDDTLARFRTNVDVERMHLTVARQGGDDDASETLLAADLETREGREAVEAFFASQVPGLAVAPKLVRSREGHFMDKPDNVISCINLATIRSLEVQWGQSLNPLRFRANIYIDGAEPWQEFDWVGSDVMLGDALFRVDRRNGRCGATNVNPATGARDMDIPGALRRSFGHKDLGVYLLVRKGGKVVIGDRVVAPELGAPAGDGAPAWQAPAGAGSYICRGCYYVYEEAKGAPGLAPGTTFAAISPNWRCPDCGTDKATFRPYWVGISDPLTARS